MNGNIEKIVFRVGGFFGFDNFDFAVNKDGTATLSHESVSGRCTLPNDTSFSKSETKQFLKAFEETGVLSWNRYYIPEYMVCDGTHWCVEVERKGKRKFIREGDNLYPPRWGTFCALFGIYLDEVKTAILKLKTNKTVALSYTEDVTCTVQLTETIYVDFDACSVNAERMKDKYIVFQSHVIAENESFETLNDDMTRVLTYDWSDKQSQPDTADIPFYALTVTLYDGTIKTHEGIYDKNHVPEDWQDVMNSIRHFVPDDGKFLLLDNKSFYSVKGDTDMTFYSVDVWGSGRSYYYFSHDDTLKPGDRVIVPFGRDNEQRYGTVTKIEYFSPEALPYPAEKTKYIERRLEPDEKIPEKTVYCPVIDDEITGTDCMTITDVADKLMPVSELWNEVTWNEEQRSRCLACKWHHDSIEYSNKSNNEVAASSSDFTEQDVIDAHRFSGSNQEELSKGEKCGCFYCGKIFNSKEISYYLTDDNDCDRGGTAFCPYCEIDSVIGESSGYPITEEFLDAMKKEWF